MIKTKNPLSNMLSPKSIAIVGASGDKGKIGYRLVSNLKDLGYKGEVSLVNPKYDEIAGYTCYKAIEELPKDIDLVLVSIAASRVSASLQKLKERNVKSIIIMSSGYAEIGEEGAKLEQELTDFSKENNIPICGPNTIGLANFKEQVLASFSTLKATEPDPVAFVTQSGAVGTLSYTHAKDMGIGYQYFISTGNEAGTDFFDFVHYLAEQDDLKVVAGYLEGARDFEKMERALEACRKANKPLVLMKVGNSAIGAVAASSHTASIAGNAQLYSSFLKERNVVRVNDEEELTDTVSVFTKTPLTTREGGIAIITQSGGAGIIMADQSEKKDLRFSKLSAETNQKLKNALPAFASIKNPIDITAQVSQAPEQILESVEITLQDDDVEAIILYLQMTDDKFLPILPRLSEIIGETDKKVVFCWSGVQPETQEEILKYKNICWIPNPTRAINALSNVMNYAKNMNNKPVIGQSGKLTETNTTPLKGKLNEWESKNLLKDYGISVPKGKLLKSIEELESANLNFPVVMKAVSSEIEHKSEFNLVQLNIHTFEEAKEIYQLIVDNIEKHSPDSKIDGILIEEMAEGGTEVIIGAVNDPLFGPSVMFGLGGIFVELLKDVVVLPVPIDRSTAHSMINSIKYNQVLQGARGKFYDVEALTDVIVRISELCEDKKDSLVEFDINPLIVHEEGKGVTAVDAFITGK